MRHEEPNENRMGRMGPPDGQWNGEPQKWWQPGDALPITQERLASVLHTVPVIMYPASPGGDLGATWVSANVERITGFPASRFIEDAFLWASRLHLDDRAHGLDRSQELAETGPLTSEYRWQCSGGSYRCFLDQAALMRDPSGRPQEVIGAWLDITEHRKAEAALCEDAETRAIRGVVLSADSTPGRVQRHLAGGARAHLAKPSDMAKILDAVGGILREGAS